MTPREYAKRLIGLTVWQGGSESGRYVGRAATVDEIEATITEALAAQREEADALKAFHDAWVECEVASATGSPDVYREKRQQLVKAHSAIRSQGKSPR